MGIQLQKHFKCGIGASPIIQLNILYQPGFWLSRTERNKIVARKVGVLFYSFNNARYRCFQRIVGYRFTEHLFVSERREIYFRPLGGKHYMVRIIQGRRA